MQISLKARGKKSQICQRVASRMILHGKKKSEMHNKILDKFQQCGGGGESIQFRHIVFFPRSYEEINKFFTNFWRNFLIFSDFMMKIVIFFQNLLTKLKKFFMIFFTKFAIVCIVPWFFKHFCIFICDSWTKFTFFSRSFHKICVFFFLIVLWWNLFISRIFWQNLHFLLIKLLFFQQSSDKIHIFSLILWRNSQFFCEWFAKLIFSAPFGEIRIF